MFSALDQKPEVRPQTENPTSDSNSLRQTDPKPLITAYLDQLQKVRDFLNYRSSYSDFSLDNGIGFGDLNLIHPKSIRAPRSWNFVKMICCRSAAGPGWAVERSAVVRVNQQLKLTNSIFDVRYADHIRLFSFLIVFLFLKALQKLPLGNF